VSPNTGDRMTRVTPWPFARLTYMAARIAELSRAFLRAQMQCTSWPAALLVTNEPRAVDLGVA